MQRVSPFHHLASIVYYDNGRFVHRRLPEKLVELIEGEKKSIEVAIPIAFKMVDEEFLNKYSHLRGMAIGTCVIFAILEQGMYLLHHYKMD